MKSAIGSTFAWTSSRLRKPAAKDKRTSKDKNIFQVVMTPDCIPKFFIPSLDVAHIDFDLKSVKLPENWCLRRRLSDVINSKCPSVYCNSESFIKEKSMKRKETWYKKDSLFLAEGLVDYKMCTELCVTQIQQPGLPCRCHISSKLQPHMGFLH